MPVLRSKRQVTLPRDLCDRLGLCEGDDLSMVEHNGAILIFKQEVKDGESTDETGYLLESPANADHLSKSIDQLKNSSS